MKFDSPTKFKWVTGCLCCWTVICVNVAIFTSMVINSVVDKRIKDTLIMISDNQDMWGEVPGKYDIFVQRNLTLFNITNPDDLYYGQKPIQVQHTRPIYLREKHLVKSTVFTNNGELVSFNQTFTYDLDMPQADYDMICNEKVTIANLYAMGAWDTAAKRLNMSQKAFYTLGMLFTSMVADDNIYYEAISLGTIVLYIQRADFKELYNRDFAPAGISMEKAQWIYSDSLHGWSNNVTIKRWVQAVDRGVESDVAIYLADYFDLTFDQISKLFTGRFSKAVSEVVMLTIANYNCPPVQDKSCDSNFLAAIQVGRQEVTLRPPPPVTAFATLGLKNMSVFGMPELSYYYTDFFLKHISQEAEYQNLSLTVNQTVSLFQFDPEGYVVDSKSNLIHPINIDRLIRAGQSFESTLNVMDFSSISTQLNINSVYLTRVIYEWCKYAAVNFSTSDTGSMEIATKTKWAQDVLDKNIGWLMTTLKPLLQVESTYSYVKSSGKDCATLVKNSLMNPSQTVIQNFCGSSWSKPSLQTLINFCNRPTTSNFQKNKGALFGFTFIQLRMLCDRDDDAEDTVGDLMNFTETRLAQQYGCVNGHCSAFEIAMQQITNSAITKNPPTGTSLSMASSISSWLPDIFAFPFELTYFLEKRSLVGKLAPMSLEDAKESFDWNNMRSPLSLTKAIADRMQGKQDFITQRMHFSDVKIFEMYIGYLALDGYLGGLTFTGKVCDIIFGLTPGIINKMRSTPPLKGGDPSTPEFISMNQNNSWLQQTRYTGKSDLSLVGNYYSTNNNRSINMLKQYWDGKTVTNQTANPWAEDLNYQGGDSNFVPHSTTGTKQWGYISDLYKSLGSIYDSKAKKNLGLQTIKYKADEKDGQITPENQKFYMEKYVNVLNYTSVKQAPVYISKMGFHSTNQSVINNVNMADFNGYPFVWEDDMDGYLYIEPHTGVPMDLAINFQINVDLSQDSVLETRNDFLIPVFLLRRTMTLNDKQVIN